jgi:hypothetical protein
MTNNKEKSCPLGHTCDRCHWNIHIRGIDPTTNQEVDQEKCAIAWIPVLLIENSQQQRSTGAAVESFRNEMAGANEAYANVMLQQLALQQQSQHKQDPKLIGNDEF